MKSSGMDRHARRRKERLSAILIVVLLCIAVVGLITLGVQAVVRHRAEDTYAKLAEQTWINTNKEEISKDSSSQLLSLDDSTEPEKDAISILEEMGIPIPDKTVDIAAMREEVNGDIYAWIYIPDTVIDYPVLQHPTDNSYYLNYNIDGSKGYPGCIYTENYNKKDFTDPNTVMYGHNMKNGLMFAGLRKFGDNVYFDEHPYVYIYTEDTLLVYEIFAAYESDNEHILYGHDFTDADAFRDYLNGIFQVRSMNANIRESTVVTEDDRILTLSTCIADKPDNRYLVQGVLLNEG